MSPDEFIPLLIKERDGARAERDLHKAALERSLASEFKLVGERDALHAALEWERAQLAVALKNDEQLSSAIQRAMVSDTGLMQLVMTEARSKAFEEAIKFFQARIGDAPLGSSRYEAWIGIVADLQALKDKK